MQIFNKFTSTVFYKKDSELEYQINALNNVIKKYPDNIELQKKLRLCELGLKGEKEIEFELKNANIGMYVLHDINIEYKDLKAQIDYIVITPAKVYFIECKNLAGNITIDNNGNFIREWYYNNHKIKESIYNPFSQAKRHIDVLKKIWLSRNNGILDKIRFKNMDNYYVPLVVLTNSKNILDNKNAPKEIKNNVIKSDNLVKFIKNDLESADKSFLWSKEEMKECAFSIMQNYNQDIERDYENELIEYINKQNNIKKTEKNTIKQEKNNSNIYKINNILEIRKKLIEYRKSKAKLKNIPAYYIFTNDELDQILNIIPKTTIDLKNSKILSSVKFNLHGSEIIKIINENL